MSAIEEEKLRVLQVTEFYPPHIGGLERHVQLLSHELRRRGHTVEVVAPSSEATYLAADGDLSVRRIRTTAAGVVKRLSSNADRVFHPTVPDPGMVRRLQDVVDQFRPDVIHAHGWVLYSVLSMVSFRGARVLVTLHDNALICANRVLLRAGRVCSGPAVAKCVSCNAASYGLAKAAGLALGLRASRPLHRRLDGVIAVSSAVGHMADQGLEGTRARRTVIPGFVSEERLGPERARPSFLPERDGFVLFVGALGAAKGLDVLLEAYRQGIGAELVLIGTPVPGFTVPALEGVTVHQSAPHSEVMAAWSRCSVAVIPSVCLEAFGLVALEAMSQAKPVVASARGGLVDIVEDGRSGILIPASDADALRKAILSLTQDAPRAAFLGEGALARSEAFRVDAVVSRIDSFYAELVSDAQLPNP